VLGHLYAKRNRGAKGTTVKDGDVSHRAVRSARNPRNWDRALQNAWSNGVVLDIDRSNLEILGYPEHEQKITENKHKDKGQRKAAYNF
jgi:hypothetical protein